MCVWGGGGGGERVGHSALVVSLRAYGCIFSFIICAPQFLMGGGEYSITFVHTFVRTNNGFRAISFETIGVLDSNFIHR